MKRSLLLAALVVLSHVVWPLDVPSRPLPKDRDLQAGPTWLERSKIGDWAEYSYESSDGWVGTEKLVVLSKSDKAVVCSFVGVLKRDKDGLVNTSKTIWELQPKGHDQYSLATEISKGGTPKVTGRGEEVIVVNGVKHRTTWEAFTMTWERTEVTQEGETTTVVRGKRKLFYSPTAPFFGVVRSIVGDSHENCTITRELIASGSK